MSLKEVSHVVIKLEDIPKYLSKEDANDLEQLIIRLDLTKGTSASTYHLVNTDEPYADEVLKVILKGEEEKKSEVTNKETPRPSSRLDKSEILPVLRTILQKINNREINALCYEKDAIMQVIEQYETKERPMSAYYDLESWLYNGGGKDKPVELKSAMSWGGLWIVKNIGCIDWDAMRRLYGEFMSNQMNIR